MPHIDSTSLLVVAVFFVATLIRSTFGFGEALVSVPLLAFLIPVKVAAPAAALVSITVAAIVLVQDTRHVHVRGAAALVVSTLFGIPLGLALLRMGSERVVKSGLGIVIVAFAIWSMRQRGRYVLTDDRLAWLFGVSAGVLGGAYGMNGPPLVVYGSLRRWNPQQFRATLQGYFLPASAAGMAGYWAAGLWTTPVTTYFAEALPLVLVAIGLGRAINRRFAVERFFVYVQAGLLASGAGLLLQALVAGR